MGMTRELKNFLGVFQSIVDNYKNEEIYTKAHELDKIAEKCLTFAEFIEYTKQTLDYLDKMVIRG